ncbi:oligosaccharide flippase family protein [Rugamonas sp. DEMB1]|uniref:oligosaccharide flippase family protein n=1 Tax=Rugamonas sp. DEMB1 TaxID=3039386 RepID=UPI0024475D7B|nr:oligosaccharide flippase family protein [Rugamonas sp. DEMB1]WGG52989.1 oligosaccharide flippase family protein [Rugamonas sp. DEMB1]
MSALRRSLLFSFAEKYLLLLLATLGSMVLARALTPAEIGVYSVAAVLVGMAQVVRDFGVGQYLIQEKELTPDKLRAALGASLLVAWPLAALLVLLAPALAGFYHQPALRAVLQLLALNVALVPYSAVALPLLRRRMRFAAIFSINLTHSLAQLGCSVALALLGFGALSLACGALAGTLAATCASLCCRPAGAALWPGRRGIAAVLRFGAYSTAGGLVDEAGVAAPELVIGRMIGVAEVGIFGKANGLLGLFNQAVTSAVSPVVFPLYAARARGGLDAKQAYLTTVAYITALAWPFFGFVGVMADALLDLLYGPQWRAAAPLIRVMCFSSAFYSMFSMARYLLVALGQVKAQAGLDAAAVPVRVAALLLAAPFGLYWVAWAVVLGALYRGWLTYRCLARLAGLRWGELLLAVARSAPLAALSCAGAALARHWPALPDGPARLALAGAAALLLWLLGIGLLRHPLAAEFALARRRAWALLVK